MKFVLPELGEGVHEGELVKWRVKPGEKVKFDQPLCEVMTDKATVEIPSAFEGAVEGLHAKEGETVKVGQTLLTFEGHAAEAAASSAAQRAHATPAAAPAINAAPMADNRGAPKSGPAVSQSMAAAPQTDIATRPLAAPSTRKAAREAGVDLTRIPASGPHGRIMKEDFDRFLTGGSAAVSAGAPSFKAPSRVMGVGTATGVQEERVPFKGLRKKIAEKMRLSKDKAAHFTYVEEADATALVAIRAQAKEIAAKQGLKITYLPFVMKAMVAALRKFPILNATFDEQTQEIVYRHYFNIGLSIQTEDGLTAPNIKNVESKGVFELAREIEELVNRARSKRLTQEDFQGGTITLTNAGSIGGLFATPVINFPEVAILGFNKIFRKPVAVTVNGREEIAIRDWTYFSISLDHRIVDGAVGAEYMKDFIRYIENPALFVLES